MSNSCGCNEVVKGITITQFFCSYSAFGVFINAANALRPCMNIAQKTGDRQDAYKPRSLAVDTLDILPIALGKVGIATSVAVTPVELSFSLSSVA